MSHTVSTRTTDLEAMIGTCGRCGQPRSTKHQAPAEEKNSTAERSSAWMHMSSSQRESASEKRCAVQRSTTPDTCTTPGSMRTSR